LTLRKEKTMHDKPKESDWTTFRAMVPEWRERYLRRCNPELVAILQDESLTPTEQFWNAEKRIGEEEKILRKCLDGHSRARMVEYLMLMYRHQMLTDEDLERFSEELRGWVIRLSEI
jgi:hypothetical protein